MFRRRREDNCVRIAVVSTPRSGNTWLSGLLASTLGAERYAYHTPEEIPWDAMGGGASVLQIHWYPTFGFRRTMRARGFKTVTITRHPCDVLLSILHFAAHAPETAQWLRGREGDERRIARVKPTDPLFAEYCVSRRAGVLLGVSAAWARRRETVTIRYEDLVNDTITELNRVLEEYRLMDRVAKTPEESVKLNSLDNLRRQSTNEHFWQGKPGLWKKLFIAGTAREIVRLHEVVFKDTGYTCDYDPTLTVELADQFWESLVK